MSPRTAPTALVALAGALVGSSFLVDAVADGRPLAALGWTITLGVCAASVWTTVRTGSPG